MMTDKLHEFKSRQKEWRDISVTQLSNANNVILTLSSGLLVLCIDKGKALKFYVDFSQSIDWLATTYWVSIFLLGLSITFGIAVLLTRLYDFRISRHIILTRQRFYKLYKTVDNHKKELSYEDLGDFSWTDRISALGQILFCKLPLITHNEIKKINDEEKFEEKFKRLRTLAEILGTASWLWIKNEVILFLISGLTYLIHQLL